MQITNFGFIQKLNIAVVPAFNVFEKKCLLIIEFLVRLPPECAVLSKVGNTVRFASIFAKKYRKLVRYAFFYHGTVTVRWYAV